LISSAPQAAGNKTPSDSRVITKVAPYSPLFILAKGEDYYQVKDHSGRGGWVHRTLLSQTRGVIVTGDSANISQGSGTNHPVIFQISKGVTAKFIEKQDKWIRVEIANGKTCSIANFLIWGD
jgi:SH3-like domain-containing protein